MSTTFGIRVPNIEEPVEVAFRHGVGNGEVHIDVLNPLIFLVPKDTPIEALDNTNQGINTLEDILNHPNLIV